MPHHSVVPLLWLWSLFLQLPVLASQINCLDCGNNVQTLVPRTGLTPQFKSLVIAHGLLCVLGFALCLPAGALLARYLRTSRPWWYTGHWIAQFGLAGPIILIGVALGYAASSGFGKTAKSAHKACQSIICNIISQLNVPQSSGSIILGLYFIQCAVGAVIHFFKPKKAKRRPIQNYFHAILGLVVIALGMYQIHTGYDEEVPNRGLGKLPAGVNVLWIIWCILLVLSYSAGMWLLRKQYAQETAARLHSTPTFVETGRDHIGMAAL
ncbi:hypothetical protein B0H19DRAFT_1384902 [Mycena capillaripes]|nr:hypothetical protein B0H19DRAFT_1384902 [Mycena capillaripes]